MIDHIDFTVVQIAGDVIALCMISIFYSGMSAVYVTHRLIKKKLMKRRISVMYAIRNNLTGAYLRRKRLEMWLFMSRSDAFDYMRALNMNKECYSVVWVD